MRGRGEPLLVAAWAEHHADWIAVVCSLGAIFTKSQLSACLGIYRKQARRIVRTMVDHHRIAVEESIEGKRICRIFAARIYRALGLEHWHGATPPQSADVAIRRLLALDCVIEHTALPWRLTTDEKLRAFDALGVARHLLPKRPHPKRRVAKGDTTAGDYFYRGYPIAVDHGGGRVLFSYVDPGHTSGRGLAAWGERHRPLWHALRAEGWRVEVLAAVRSGHDARRARGRLDRWSSSAQTVARGAHAAIRRDIERVERVIVRGTQEEWDAYGGVNATLRRLTELRDLERRTRPLPTIDEATVWRSRRLAGDRL